MVSLGKLVRAAEGLARTIVRGNDCYIEEYELDGENPRAALWLQLLALLEQLTPQLWRAGSGRMTSPAAAREGAAGLQHSQNRLPPTVWAGCRAQGRRSP